MAWGGSGPRRAEPYPTGLGLETPSCFLQPRPGAQPALSLRTTVPLPCQQGRSPGQWVPTSLGKPSLVN